MSAVRGSGAARFALVFTAVAAISFLRDPNAFLRPTLAFEDGRDIFGFFYQGRGLETLFRPYAGYVVLVPNLMGWLALAAPARVAPHLVALLPLALSSATFAWLSRREYRGLLPSDAARAGASLLLALAPVTNARFVGNTMYSVWSAFLLLVLMSLAPPPRSGRAAAARLLGMSILIWSHPLSVLLVPVWLAQALWPDRRVPAPGGPLARLFYAELAAVALLYQLAGVDHARLAALAPLELLTRTLLLSLERVVFGAIFGDAAAFALRASGLGLVIPVAAFAALAALAVALVRARAALGRREAAALVTLAWVIAGTTALCALGRQVDLELLRSTRGARFFWVQRVLFLVVLMQCAGLVVAARRAAGAPPARALRALALSLVAVWLVALNFENNRFYQVSRAEGEAVRAFAAEVARQEQALGGRAQVRAHLERGHWSIELEP